MRAQNLYRKLVVNMPSCVFQAKLCLNLADCLLDLKLGDEALELCMSAGAFLQHRKSGNLVAEAHKLNRARSANYTLLNCNLASTDNGLKMEWRKLQRTNHPDKFGNDAAQQFRQIQISQDLNRAFDDIMAERENRKLALNSAIFSNYFKVIM